MSKANQVKFEFDGISKVFRHLKPVEALKDLNFQIGEKEFLCILGPSGCGKSTALNLLAGFIHPSSGEVRLNGRPIQGPGPDRGVVFQRHSLFPWKTIRANIEFGLRMRRVPRDARRETVDRYLKEMELTDFAESYPFELSVGMQQRVGLARAYANNPSVLLMDEPFASLDALTALRMRELLLGLWTENPKPVLFVTHDVDEAILLADRVLVFSSAPGSVREEIRIDLPRPRPRQVTVEPRYTDVRKRLLDLVLQE